ncbi:MAG: carbon-nitrogen hydrolase family protein, partial [Planctomycetota bacterium]
NGGTALAGPAGEWIVEPVTDREDLIVVEIDHQRVLEERQNFDPSGHYARPDVLKLTVDRTRQRSVDWIDG